MKKALQIILHILGFPLLILLVIIFSLNMFKLSISYGIMAFIGLIITVFMAIIYYLVYFLMAKRGKKSIYKQTIVLIIVSSLCLGGFWMLIDVALPDLLADATSNTIYYEDLADDYNTRAEVNRELLDEFIKRNHTNGNLEGSLKQYLSEGYRNKEVRELIKTNFESIDKDGYATFVGPWIDLANDDRMTIPTLIHLLINERDLEEVPFLIRVDGEMLDDPTTWTVLDMVGDPMEFDLGEDGMGLLSPSLSGLLGLLFNDLVNDVLHGVSNTLEDENFVGAPVYIELSGGSVLYIVPTNVNIDDLNAEHIKWLEEKGYLHDRGVLDYKRMAWLDSNSLIVMITSLFSIRKLFLIFAGVIMITTYAIGLLREQEESQQSNKEREGKKEPQKNVDKNMNSNKSIVTDSCHNYKSSYIVVKKGEPLNIQGMTCQLLYDDRHKIIKRYDAAIFLNE